MPTSKRSGEKKVSAKGEKRSHVKDKGVKHLLSRRLKHTGEFKFKHVRAPKFTPVATQLDPDDAPVLTEEFFERADVYNGNKLVRAGRPRSANPKLALKLRIDPDVVEYFRATGPGWQTRINDTLRKAAKVRYRSPR
jgi:uncharacterized protein (DUF4415 family)